MALSADPASRRERARRALDGLSVGDGFGERFFGADGRERATQRILPPPVWRTTDDTEMAIALMDVLEAAGQVDQDRLARAFAARFGRDPDRGYGRGAYGLLSSFRNGLPWNLGAAAMFGGEGSRGNGAAMRVAPLGAYFADDLREVVRQAQASAEVTHAHPDGIAGAIAVAVGAAWMARGGEAAKLLEVALDLTPAGETREGLVRAASTPGATPIDLAAHALGCGREVLSSDTVPFCLWVATHHGSEFEEALWNTVRALGDRDTTCAIVGGILGSERVVPALWLSRREPLRRDAGASAAEDSRR